jgi:hypothetical protein
MSNFQQDVDDFEHALEAYKQRHGRMFPTCSEILEVARDLGFSRPEPAVPAADTQFSDSCLNDAADEDASLFQALKR